MEETRRRALRVAVLAGGMSDEREVSLSSGDHVVQTLKQAGYGAVDMVDPAQPGFLRTLDEGAYDVAFIALHGEGGEDGTMQGALELIGLPFTGSDARSSAYAVDKDISKLLYARAGIPVAPSVALRRGDEVCIDDIVRTVGEQAFVKPVSNGSSYGVRPAAGAVELAEAIEYAFSFGEKIMVERRVEGTEVSVGVLGDGDTLRPLPIVEIRVPESAGFYDLSVKYVDPTEIHRIPAQIPDACYEQVQRYACAAHRALGCYGFSRSDFIVGAEGPVILETNTIPGMTRASLFPDELHYMGMPFADALDELIELALARAEWRRR